MDIRIAESIVKHYKTLKSIDQICPLNKGRSLDKKYILLRKKEKKFILRLGNINRFDKSKKVFKITRIFHQKGVKCLKPVALGKTPDHKYSYSIVKYLDGKSGHSILSNLSNNDQFKIGIAAGEELKKLHQLKCPKAYFNWFIRRYSKFLKDLKVFKDLKLSFYKDKYVLDYVNDHINLMKGRPVRFLHNDFNISNIIIKNKKFNGIIDFNVYDWGDPLHDFYKLPWGSKSCSVHYVKGVIIGYCGGKISNTFWKMYNLYVMMNIHRKLVWVYQRKPSKIQMLLKVVEEIVKEHNLKSSEKPIWF